jgi:excisionase family DNA binding protein
VSDRFHSPKDVCELLDISRPTLTKMLNRGDLPHVRVGRRIIRIPARAVSELLHERGTEESKEVTATAR